MYRAWLVLLAGGLLTLASCAPEELPRETIYGKWVTTDTAAEQVDFYRDGCLHILGEGRGQRLRGTFKFLNNYNLDIKFRLPEEDPWRPQWLPPGVLKDPHIRAYATISGDQLTLRIRVEIRAEDLTEFIEVNTIDFTRVSGEVPE